MDGAERPDSEFARMLRARGSVRKFRPDPVPQTMVEAIVDLGARAPTSGNRQEYSVIQVDDPETRRKLSELGSGQQHIVDCAVFLAVCADQNRVAKALDMHGKDFPSFNFESGLISTIDAALFGLTMSYAADSFGLSGVLVGAMRNHPVEIASILGLPPRCYCVFGLCLGYAAAPPLPKPRIARGVVLHRERYDPAGLEQAIEDYDGDLAAYYRRRGVETVDSAWSEVLSQKFSVPRRMTLRDELRQLGFPFE